VLEHGDAARELARRPEGKQIVVLTLLAIGNETQRHRSEARLAGPGFTPSWTCRTALHRSWSWSAQCRTKVSSHLVVGVSGEINGVWRRVEAVDHARVFHEPRIDAFRAQAFCIEHHIVDERITGCGNDQRAG